MAQTDQAPAFVDWTWDDIEPRYRELEAQSVDEASAEGFLREWSALADRIQELGARLELATTQNTADEEASQRYRRFVQETQPKAREAENTLQRKLLASDAVPAGMQVPIRRMRVEAELFREENLPLLSKEAVLGEEYFKVTGAQTVEWDGREIPVTQLRPVLEETDRERRERAWRLGAERRLQDTEAIDEIWRTLLDLRQRIAANAGFPDYRAYRWRNLKRFDYTPRDAQEFHRSVEDVVIPAMARLRERRRQRLGVETLRPWDTIVDPLGRLPLRPYTDAGELPEKLSTIFRGVDPVLGDHFNTMRKEGLLDLESRPNKAPGGYCTSFSASRRPFIFMNGAGTRIDVETLLHEGGHAFHVFETASLPYFQQRYLEEIPMEFAEVGSMAMEFLSEPYLPAEEGGFYSRVDAARARLDHLEERVLTLWAFIVLADAFQHWVYEHPEEAANPAACDARWAELNQRFAPGVDWSGLEAEMTTSWRDILHIIVIPFYMIEYAFAQLGAVQIWANAQRNQAEAVQQYRHALSLGGTASLPDLFSAAGARFAFDRQTLRDAVDRIGRAIEELEQEIEAA